MKYFKDMGFWGFGAALSNSLVTGSAESDDQ